MRAETATRAYLANWLALLGLTALTFGLSHLPLGAWHLPISIAIALAKATLIGLVFMHLVDERFTMRFVLVAASLLLLLLMLLVLLDISTRFPLATPPGSRRWEMSRSGQVD